MKTFLKEYFSFSSRERTGSLVLLLAIIAVICFPYAFAMIFREEKMSPATLRAEMDVFEKSMNQIKLSERQDSVYARNYSENNDSLEKKIHKSYLPAKSRDLYTFDPNKLTDEGWKRLGLKEWQIRTLRKYKEKGGKFLSNEDLKKMRFISDSLYAVLEPFIAIKRSGPGFSTFEKRNVKADSSVRFPEKLSKYNFSIIELNEADSLALLSLSGIGPWRAHKIISYRDRLGGFYSKEQLLEISGIDSTLFHSLSDFLTADILKIRKININNESFGKIPMHPYLNFGVCRNLINYRLQHGNFKSIAEIKKLALVDEDLYSKLANYLEAR